MLLSDAHAMAHRLQEHSQRVAIVARNLTALRELVDQVLTADRLGGHVQIRREPLELREVIEGMVGLLPDGVRLRPL
jgi:hypothetical protein